GPERVFRNWSIEPVAAGKRKDAPHDVLFLAVDSLRPDMIDEEHTPHLARLLSESIYFPNTLVTQPRTGPSWTATLTGMPPLLNGIETMFPDASHSQVENFSLPAHLASYGYRTAVFSEYAGEFFSRANFGFQVAAVPSVELKDITGQMLMMRVPTVLAAASLLYTQGSLGHALLGRRIDNLMRGMANFASPQVLEDDMLTLAHEDRREPGERKTPFFWLVFYSQPHFPYTSSSDFYPKYEVAGSAPELRFGRDAVSDTPIESPEDRKQVVGLYRAALAETDAAIGKLLDRLKVERLLDNTIIVLMADHGEGLYECPTCVGHGDNLRSLSTLKVPLAFHLPRAKFPQAKPERLDQFVSQLDVYPTILALLGHKRLAPQEGVALLNRKGQVQRPPERDFFAETGEWLWPTPAVPHDRIAYPVITEMAKLEHGRIAIDPKYLPEIRAAKQRAVIRPPYELSYEPGASEVTYHLYQFEQDPYETNDLMAAEPEIASDLKRALARS
ncbi:MAG TPA: sulfatase-like hydrolase/transferase, partial [Polyangiaceae bacterium]|nr:sulfatase-like hydrolase/transferase [Polyangiaceae bacterium]